MHKQILLLAADISDNSLGRVWILADMLAGAAKVEILGLSMKNRVWAPLASNAAHWMTWLPGGRLPNVLGTLRLALAVRQNPADILYVCKPRFPNFVAALLGRRGRRIVLDIDDWEAGCARGNFSSSRIINALAARGISFTQIADWLIPLAKARTVCNPLFQQRYGGELVPHARSEKAFAPQEDIAALRAQFGLPQDARLVMFFGTPHRHKGVDELITAMTLASDKHLHMLIAGLDPQMAEYADYARAAEAALPGRYSFLHYIPWQDAPQLLACADILVVPQKDTPFTRWGQTPAKLFDAMAAGKPLVVSDIADTSQLVGEHAWLTPPGDAAAIAHALDDICADLPAAQARGQQLRQRFLEHYSYAKVAPRLRLAVLGT